MDDLSNQSKTRKIPQLYTKCCDRHARANNVDPDQTPQNAASDQGLHYLPSIEK